MVIFSLGLHLKVPSTSVSGTIYIKVDSYFLGEGQWGKSATWKGVLAKSKNENLNVKELKLEFQNSASRQKRQNKLYFKQPSGARRAGN